MKEEHNAEVEEFRNETSELKVDLKKKLTDLRTTIKERKKSCQK